MTKNQLLQVFEQYPDVQFVLLGGFDEAIVGVCDRKLQPQPVLIYSVAKIIEILTRRMADEPEPAPGWGVAPSIAALERETDAEEMAWEWFSFNIQDAWMGDGTPAFLWDVPDEPKEAGEPHP